MSSSLRPVLALLLAGTLALPLSGCFDDAPGVFGGRRCADALDCPTGDVCQLGRCAPGGDASVDATPDDAEPVDSETGADRGAPDQAELDAAIDSAVDAEPDAERPDLMLDPDAASVDLDVEDAMVDVDAAAPDQDAPDMPIGPMECAPGTARACGLLAGECERGLQACDETGRWGDCEGGILPRAVELCDGVDDDCDGRIDEGLVEACGEPGDCRPGRRFCVEGVWGACDGDQTPRAEVCDGFDDDCDGVVDEELIRPCSRDRGACQQGVERCMDGVWGECIGGVVPGPETCDGADEDCDGRIDEELFRACGDSPCDDAGISRCVDGVFGPCVPQRPPVGEICDGLDNDCDGAVDESLIRSCGSVVGQCSAGTTVCRDGAFSECVGGVFPADEQCNGLDDDCDGRTDEAVEPVPCGDDEGVCESGLRTCIDGAFGPCIGAIGGAPERCDQLDNDCDGRVDERLPVFPEICNGQDDDCDGTIDEDVPRSPEICNNVDDDCDGLFDEGTEARPEVCDAIDNDCDRRVDEDVVPIPELCNGVDDDCDGVSDEDARAEICGTNIGECRSGLRACVGGELDPNCEGEIPPAPEICDGLDNDCDIDIDEDVPGDRDLDGISDCLEQLVGLDPDDPRDAVQDFDHDGRNNREEALAGTPLWSTLYIVEAEPPPMADPELFFVSLRLYQPDVPARPELIEVYIDLDAARAAFVEATPGAATLDADKDMFPDLVAEGRVRVVILSGFNLDRIGSGELALLSFRRVSPEPVELRIDRIESRFAPADADEALSQGTVEHRVPLTVP